MRKLIRRWWKKLRNGLAADAKLRETNKKIVVAVIAATAAAATAQAGGGNYGGGSFDQNNTGGAYAPSWSVLGSIWQGLKEPWVWIFGAGQIDKAFDNGTDPGQAYWNSGAVAAPSGPQGSAGGEGKWHSKNP